MTPEIFKLYFLKKFFVVLGFELRAYTLSHSTTQFFVKSFFKIGSHRTICPGWLQTMILLISASRIAKITGASHRLPYLLCYVIVFSKENLWQYATRKIFRTLYNIILYMRQSQIISLNFIFNHSQDINIFSEMGIILG
jgi:hypothetical protein